MHGFTIFCTQALGGVVIMDIVGIMRGWKVFDHAGHLGGVLFTLYVHLYNYSCYGFYHYCYTVLLSIGYTIGGFIVCLKG